jgi:predicted transcriptional regulator
MFMWQYYINLDINSNNFVVFFILLHPNGSSMNKTVDLVNAWGEYEKRYPNPDIEDFCRYYLTKKREEQSSGSLFEGILPPTSQIILTKLIARISRLHHIYASIAMETIELKQVEEFIMLNGVSALNGPKKTEVIYHSIQELSTGLNILNNLKLQGYITEHDDAEDKRSKRVRITTKGEAVLEHCYRELRRVNELLYRDMSEEDILLTIQLLKNIDITFSALWQQHKGKTLDEVIQSVHQKKADQ